MINFVTFNLFEDLKSHLQRSQTSLISRHMSIGEAYRKSLNSNLRHSREFRNEKINKKKNARNYVKVVHLSIHVQKCSNFMDQNIMIERNIAGPGRLF